MARYFVPRRWRAHETVGGSLAVLFREITANQHDLVAEQFTKSATIHIKAPQHIDKTICGDRLKWCSRGKHELTSWDFAVFGPYNERGRQAAVTRAFIGHSFYD